MEGTESWVYSNIFRPTSLRITPTVDKNKDGTYSASEVGQVNGSLIIGSTPFDWKALPFKKETDTGITTSSVKWTTVNPYGKSVELNIVSEPASGIKVTKLVGRIAGYDAPSEVFSPVVWFTTPVSRNIYRITALLSRYPDEEAKTSEKVPVQGTGNALKIHSSGNVDLIYTGSGTATFDQFSTDAEVAFIRQREDTLEVTLLDGSFLKHQDTFWINTSKKADYITVRKDDIIIEYRVQADQDLRGELFYTQIDPLEIQNSTALREKKNTIAGSSSGTFSGNTTDIIALIKMIAKKVISFFNSKM
jgi:hypothetical protein